MIEHRLIERMIAMIRKAVDRAESEENIDTVFIDTAVDFIRTYADNCHYGKEDISFRNLDKKELPNELKRIVSDLMEEYKIGRRVVSDLVEAKLRYTRGN